MTATSRSIRQAAVVLFGGLAVLLLFAEPASAQVPGVAQPLEIVGIQHDPRGTVAIALRLPGGQAVLEDPVVILDEVPRAVLPRQGASRRPAAVLIVIDTSGSMAGAPIEAAREAARDFIARLSPDDEVGIVRFATTPEVVAPMSSQRAALLAAIDRLAASGATALYGAMATAAGELQRVPPARDRVLVVLSDGADDGGVSNVGRDESLRLVQATGTKAYMIGFGQQVDRSYLEALAAATGGAAWLFGDEQGSALIAQFSDIGGVVGASEVVRAEVPVLSAGTHVVTVRGRVNGAVVTGARALLVTNDGLLAPSVSSPGAPELPIEVALNSPVRLEDLALVSHIDGVEVPLDVSSGSVVVDPWEFTPGRRTLRVAAHAGPDPAYILSVPIEIPRLSPRLDVSDGDDGQRTVVGRIQGERSPAVVALVEGREVARSAGGSLSLPSTLAAGPVRLTMLDSTGAVRAEQVIEFPARGTQSASLPIVAAVLALLIPLALLLLRRRRRDASPRQEVSPVVSRSALRRGRASVTARRVAIALVRPSGAEEAYPIGEQPLTVGTSPSCDIVIEGVSSDLATSDGVLARLTVLPGGDVMIHRLRERRAVPHEHTDADEWTVLRAGEEISIGGHLLRLDPIPAPWARGVEAVDGHGAAPATL